MPKEQTFTQSQLDKYEAMQEANEKAKAFENGLAIATTLTKALIESKQIGTADVMNSLQSILKLSSDLVESNLKALRLQTEEAVLTPDVPQQTLAKS
jgi:hypothetical protein